MANFGDAVVSFPISASYNPTVYMRVTAQFQSATLYHLKASVGSQLALPANNNRLGWIITNDSPAVLYQIRARSCKFKQFHSCSSRDRYHSWNKIG